MSDFEDGKLVEVRRLRKGQDVPCDGRIYCDSDNQLCFGRLKILTDKSDFLELLASIEAQEKERDK